MSTKTSLHIADPCHEDWNKMSTTDKGRFCQSCSKQVVDFSLLSDKQILEYFSKQKGNTCGRFRDDQLDRPLDKQQAKAKVSLWKWIMTVGFGFWFSNKAVSQTGETQLKTDSKTQLVDAPQDVVYFGMVASVEGKEYVDQKTHKNLHIKGTVVNNANEPLAGASISLNGKAYKVSASDGTFSINAKIPISKDSVELSVSSIGYETKNVKVLSASKKDMLVEMIPKAAELKEVVVVAYPSTRCTMVMGGAIGVSTTVFTQVVDSVKKVTGNGWFTAYPNPARKGGAINIQLKEEGNYSLQLISNSSQLISSQKITSAKGQLFQLQISASLASGIYYIRMVNEQTGKLYTDKVVVL
ncbi:carboxypeptidase-like regulatory domain-containing protein [Pinibacter aurantiacus]|uniref:Carboxypeptidase-like regulatory domain-containing protein n=1 Tax=Pinibacter aurantiacus TaxID=2851599 RepID=A0A9E2SB59_9BACT|nr:carboxypeptidase-like regulatory domain-containing protein [Pinibacter aurantiacus]MBV4358087.1 carboxypeptidase-like regulatory domain-containing protein [Pinibacter aurantiacus]